MKWKWDWRKRWFTFISPSSKLSVWDFHWRGHKEQSFQHNSRINKKGSRIGWQYSCYWNYNMQYTDLRWLMRFIQYWGMKQSVTFVNWCPVHNWYNENPWLIFLTMKSLISLWAISRCVVFGHRFRDLPTLCFCCLLHLSSEPVKANMTLYF